MRADELMTLDKAAERVLIAGKLVSRTTLYRWCSAGVLGVRLRHGLVGRRLVVTEADIVAFVFAVGAERALRVRPVRRTGLVPRRAQSARAAACMGRLAAKGVA